jgi:glycosyltransferase involved in cell wall biosynthesis
MKDQPVVSIVTPSYNQVDFLEATIRSVLKQDYPNVEYGVVDGGSTDASLEIIKRYEDQIDWWVSEPDQGQADAINKGMSRVQGDIVAWINSDDLYMPGAIDKAVKAFRKNDPSLVFGDAITIDALGRPIKYLEFGDSGFSELIRFQMICQPAVFVKKTVWDEVGGLDRTYQYMLDYHLWLRIAEKHDMEHIAHPLAASRYHQEAKNFANAAEFSDEIFRVERWMRENPQVATYYRENKRQITGGAYNLSARYLLDGGLPKKAFSHYRKALQSWPSRTIKSWHRILFCVFSMFTGIKATDIPRPKKSIHSFGIGNFSDWPGLSAPDNGKR